MVPKQMNEDQSLSKSKLIRRYFADHPEATSSEAAAALQAQGVAVDARYAAQIRSKTRDRTLQVTRAKLAAQETISPDIPPPDAKPMSGSSLGTSESLPATVPRMAPPSNTPQTSDDACGPASCNSGRSRVDHFEHPLDGVPRIDPQAARELLVLAADLIQKAGGPSQAHQAIDAACEVARRIR